MSEYDDLLGRLTREHPVTVHTDDGPRFIRVPGLLQQLRDEVFGSMESGAVSGNRQRLPLNAPALDQYELIDRQIAEVWANAFHRVPNADKAERLLAEWAAYIGAETLVTYSVPEQYKLPSRRYGVIELVRMREYTCTALNLLRRWVHAIETLFDPPRTAEIAAACIQCGERKVKRPKDGVLVDQTALVFIRDRETGESREARCLACGASWFPAQFMYLAEKIAENERSQEADIPVNPN